MQFSVIRTLCASRFADASNAVVSDAQWKDYVNGRYRKVQSDNPYWPWTESRKTDFIVTAGTHVASLDVNEFRVGAMWNATDKYPMVPMEGRSSYRSEFPSNDEQGSPQLYRVFGYSAGKATIEVYPQPTVDTTIYVDLWVPAADLNADADLPVFPSQFHDLLVEGALADAYLDDGNLPLYQAHDAEYGVLLQNMKTSLLGPRQERYYEIVDDWY